MGCEAHWPAGTLAFGLWHRFVSAQTLWAFDHAGSCLTSLGLVCPLAFDHAGSCLALRLLTSLGLVWQPWAFDHAGSVVESSQSSESLGDLLSL